MQKVFFFTDENKERYITRSRAKGHNALRIEDNVDSGTPVEIVTEGRELVIRAVEDDNSEKEYCFLCSEFGLGGKEGTLESTVSVIYLDKGLMLVTLHKGGILFNINGKIMMPTVELDKVPKVDSNEVNWIDSAHLLQFHKLSKDRTKADLYQDYEYYMELSGDNINEMHRINYKALSNLDVDLSLGQIAVMLQKKKNKADAKSAQMIMSQVMANTGVGESAFEDEEDDEDWEDDEDDDWVDDDDFF